MGEEAIGSGVKTSLITELQRITEVVLALIPRGISHFIFHFPHRERPCKYQGHIRKNIVEREVKKKDGNHQQTEQWPIVKILSGKY